MYLSRSLQENGFSVGHLQRPRGRGSFPTSPSHPGKAISLRLSRGEELQEGEQEEVGLCRVAFAKSTNRPQTWEDTKSNCLFQESRLVCLP